MKATKKLSTNLLQLSGTDLETAEDLAARASKNTPHSDAPTGEVALGQPSLGA